MSCYIYSRTDTEAYYEKQIIDIKVIETVMTADM